jgi:hypothetical protein
MEACPCRDRPAVHCAFSTLYTLISRGVLSRFAGLRSAAFGFASRRSPRGLPAEPQLAALLLASRSPRQGGTGGEGGTAGQAKFQTAPVPATALRHNLLTQRLMASQNLAASYVMTSVQLHI